jgi:hypothetical protein
VKTIASNCLAILGCGLMVYGMAMFHPALGYLAGGGFALSAALRIARGK